MKLDIRDRVPARSAEELRRRYDLDKNAPVLEYPLGVEKGGTGKIAFTEGSYLIGGDVITEKTSAEVRSDIGAMAKPVTLWTNPNPNSAFDPQSVAVGLSGYGYICVLASFTNSATDVCNFTVTKVGSAGVIGITTVSSDDTSSSAAFLNGAYRRFQTSLTGIVFEAGQMIYAGGAYPNWNNRAVPQEIIGLKPIL